MYRNLAVSFVQLFSYCLQFLNNYDIVCIYTGAYTVVIYMRLFQGSVCM